MRRGACESRSTCPGPPDLCPPESAQIFGSFGESRRAECTRRFEGWCPQGQLRSSTSLKSCPNGPLRCSLTARSRLLATPDATRMTRDGKQCTRVGRRANKNYSDRQKISEPLLSSAVSLWNCGQQIPARSISPRHTPHYL